MERLIVKNFGPLKYVDIELRDVNIFIGPTGSGKSTLAKLVAVMNDILFNFSTNINDFKVELNDYHIVSYLKVNTFIEYHNGAYRWSYENEKISTNYPLPGVDISRIARLESKLLPGIRVKRGLGELKKLRVESRRLSAIKGRIEKIKTYLNLKLSDGPSEDFIKIDDIAIRENIRLVVDFLAELEHKGNSIFIPAERLFYSTFSSALNSLTIQKINVPQFIAFFSDYLQEAQSLPALKVDELNLEFANIDEKILFKLQDEEYLEVSETASGIQSLMPLVYAINNFKNEESETHIIIEEPELNLFPDAQFSLIKYILKNWEIGKRAILTTHSPYILSSIDNLITANNVSAEKPKLKKKVAEVIDEKYWLDYDRVSAYYFNPNPKRGKTNTESIMNAERKGIAGNAIDSVSDELNIQYEKLNELRYS